MSTKLHNNQSGMMSFTVTLIMMIVITLIVLGFSQVAQRNQREALDRQLSSEAFYAAESGVNVTQSILASYLNGGGLSPQSKTNCVNASKQSNDYDPSNGGGSGSAVAQLSSGVSYSCVLVNPAPYNVEFSQISSGTSKVVPMSTTSKYDSLTFSWANQTNQPDNSGCTNGSTNFPNDTDWKCSYAALRVDIATVSDPIAKTFFLTPRGASSNATWSAASSYIGSAGGCSGSICTVTVQGMNPVVANPYYLRIMPLYRTANSLIITPKSAGSSVAIVGSQAIVDVTGKAQDVLRRVQVRVSLSSAGDTDTLPPYAVSSGANLCKTFIVTPSSALPFLAGSAYTGC